MCISFGLTPQPLPVIKAAAKPAKQTGAGAPHRPGKRGGFLHGIVQGLNAGAARKEAGDGEAKNLLHKQPQHRNVDVNASDGGYGSVESSSPSSSAASPQGAHAARGRVVVPPPTSDAMPVLPPAHRRRPQQHATSPDEVLSSTPVVHRSTDTPPSSAPPMVEQTINDSAPLASTDDDGEGTFTHRTMRLYHPFQSSAGSYLIHNASSTSEPHT